LHASTNRELDRQKSKQKKTKKILGCQPKLFMVNLS